jgi:hypothetical protein
MSLPRLRETALRISLGVLVALSLNCSFRSTQWIDGVRTVFAGTYSLYLLRPEDGYSKFLRNVGAHLSDYTVRKPGGQIMK